MFKSLQNSVIFKNTPSSNGRLFATEFFRTGSSVATRFRNDVTLQKRSCIEGLFDYVTPFPNRVATDEPVQKNYGKQTSFTAWCVFKIMDTNVHTHTHARARAHYLSSFSDTHTHAHTHTHTHTHERTHAHRQAGRHTQCLILKGSTNLPTTNTRTRAILDFAHFEKKRPPGCLIHRNTTQVSNKISSMSMSQHHSNLLPLQHTESDKHWQ